MVMKITIVIFLCAAWITTAKAEEEECHVYEKESPKIKNPYVTELARTVFRELKDQPYLKLNQTVVDSFRGPMFFAIVYDDGDYKIIVNVIHLKRKNEVDEGDSDSLEEYFGFF